PQVYITTNYGSGSPAEAAAWVQYANVTKKYGVKYWEVGNEIYGTWENDTNTRPHDPVTYATRFQQFVTAMKAVDPTIKVGAVIALGEDSYANYSDEVVTNPVTGQQHSGWTPVMLTTLKNLGCIPDYVIYHRYEQNAGGEDDTALLTSAQTWPDDAAGLRSMLNDYLGTAAAAGVEIDCTENNSISSNPGKQSTSLVNGLYLADSVGNLMQTEINSLIWWDLRNGPEYGNNNSPLLYGWRNYGDYGIVAGGSVNSALPAQVYPTAEVEQLLTHFARGGETVVTAGSNYWGMGAYAVVGTNGTLRVLLINKTPAYSLPTTVNLQGWGRFTSLTSYQYGMTQDNNAQAGSGSVAPSQTTVSASGPAVTVTLPPYSATVLVIP
ncbi:MAG TPA: alpha-L-arabinofuranosidase, partial [Opitutaceae bacterium]|nr:alpha-L-arabinofuranosidase [Opitutaceae bacterium]